MHLSVNRATMGENHGYQKPLYRALAHQFHVRHGAKKPIDSLQYFARTLSSIYECYNNLLVTLIPSIKHYKIDIYEFLSKFKKEIETK